MRMCKLMQTMHICLGQGELLKQVNHTNIIFLKDVLQVCLYMWM